MYRPKIVRRGVSRIQGCGECRTRSPTRFILINNRAVIIAMFVEGLCPAYFVKSFIYFQRPSFSEVGCRFLKTKTKNTPSRSHSMEGSLGCSSGLADLAHPPPHPQFQVCCSHMQTPPGCGQVCPPGPLSFSGKRV